MSTLTDSDDKLSPPPCPKCGRELNRIVYNETTTGIKWVNLYWKNDGVGWNADDRWDDEADGNGDGWVECYRCSTRLQLNADSEWIECDIDAMKALGVPDEKIMEVKL